MDSLTIEALVEDFGNLERIDHLVSLAESRRNSALREVERHAVLANNLRQSVQHIEDGEFEVLETKGKGYGLTSDRKIRANRENARSSTGPTTLEGRRRAAGNARRFGLSLPVCSDPEFFKDMEALALEIAGPHASVKMRELAHRVAEAHIDVCPVRCARHEFVTNKLNDPHYNSSTELCEKPHIARLLCQFSPAQISSLESCKEFSGDREGKQLAALGRYEQRTLSRRKFAVRTFDQAHREEATWKQPKSK
jgi:hypothetical protein